MRRRERALGVGGTERRGEGFFSDRLGGSLGEGEGQAGRGGRGEVKVARPAFTSPKVKGDGGPRSCVRGGGPTCAAAQPRPASRRDRAARARLHAQTRNQARSATRRDWPWWRPGSPPHARQPSARAPLLPCARELARPGAARRRPRRRFGQVDASAAARPARPRKQRPTTSSRKPDPQAWRVTQRGPTHERGRTRPLATEIVLPGWPWWGVGGRGRKSGRADDGEQRASRAGLRARTRRGQRWGVQGLISTGRYRWLGSPHTITSKGGAAGRGSVNRAQQRAISGRRDSTARREEPPSSSTRRHMGAPRRRANVGDCASAGRRRDDDRHGARPSSATALVASRARARTKAGWPAALPSQAGCEPPAAACSTRRPAPAMVWRRPIPGQ